MCENNSNSIKKKPSISWMNQCLSVVPSTRLTLVSPKSVLCSSGSDRHSQDGRSSGKPSPRSSLRGSACLMPHLSEERDVSIRKLGLEVSREVIFSAWMVYVRCSHGIVPWSGVCVCVRASEFWNVKLLLSHKASF